MQRTGMFYAARSFTAAGGPGRTGEVPRDMGGRPNETDTAETSGKPSASLSLVVLLIILRLLLLLLLLHLLLHLILLIVHLVINSDMPSLINP